MKHTLHLSFVHTPLSTLCTFTRSHVHTLTHINQKRRSLAILTNTNANTQSKRLTNTCTKRKPPFVSLSLSLSLTHTHTHHYHVRTIRHCQSKPSPQCPPPHPKQRGYPKSLCWSWKYHVVLCQSKLVSLCSRHPSLPTSP